ncbi:hypothetical protein JCM17846_22940 [Iodidimonas nitroreducens]|uniref:Lipoprotein n=1 Tax=Iodidimonas nitroreducens TaxID=1236968 RepID=A0A5A7N8E0_9PROT|nr:hypothetical protein [Iodidimonas nitroreducens]GAK33376.1 hypothetical protein AQ1_01266 [alpha proteobacterium Q-1]GER04612.1 hypothetical protein JCM17846_22940 [Iodidimonas nitroreducens]
MIKRRTGALWALIIGSVFLTSACMGADDQDAPDAAAIDQALSDHYELIAMAFASNRDEAERAANSIADGEPEASPDAGPEAGSDQSAEESRKCTSMEIIINRMDGRESRERFTMPCHLLDRAQNSLSQGMKALEKALEDAGLAVSNSVFSGKPMAYQRVEKIACIKAVEKPGFVCDLRVWFDDEGQTVSRYQTARFVKDRDGWIALEVSGSPLSGDDAPSDF